MADTNTSVADVLRAARAKIETPECWTKNELARDHNRKRVDPSDPRAVCWCAAGSVMSVCDSIEFRGRSYDALMNAMRSYVPDFNDTHTHAEVLDAFSKAIAAAEVSP